MPAAAQQATFAMPEIKITGKRKGWELSTEMTVPHSPPEVFPFFADAANLQQLTPPSLHFQVLSPLPIEMKRGALIEYRLRLHGVPIHWQTEITQWDPPYAFVDTQIEGPYRWWIHEHKFLHTDVEKETRVIDNVQYDLAFGTLLHPLFVKRDLQRIFAFRARVMHQLFVAPTQLRGTNA